jgi:hypothetical protein
MEPTQEPKIPVAEAPPRSRSGLKAAIAGLAVAGLLTTWGAASVFAADPSATPSASASSGSSSSGSSSDDGTATDNCPDRSGSDSSGSGGQRRDRLSHLELSTGRAASAWEPLGVGSQGEDYRTPTSARSICSTHCLRHSGASNGFAK